MDVKKKNQIKDLVKMCVDNKLDFLKVGDIEIKKSIHFNPPQLNNGIAKTPEQIMEEELFWSSTPGPRINK